MKKILAIAAAALLPATAVQADEWKYTASIYGYFPSIGGSTSFPTTPGAGTGSGIEVSADKILDALKFTFMGSLDVHNGRWGAFTDIVYIDLGQGKSQTRDFSIGNVGLPANVSANLNYDLKGTLWTLAGEYRMVSEPAFTIDLVAGARYFDLDQTLRYEFSGDIASLPLATRDGSSTASLSVWDAVIGVKGRYMLGEERRWSVPFYLDVGAGESDRTWQGAVGLGYAFKWGEVSALYRYLDYRFKSDKRIQDMNFSGPMIGASFRW